MYAILPLLNAMINPTDSAFKIWTTLSPEYMPEIENWTPFRCWRIKSSVAALAMDSQYVTLPLLGMIMTSPGSVDDAEAATKDPSGRGSDSCLEAFGSSNVNVSGEGTLTAYGQTMA
jgi:hypothetical protein